MRDDAGDRFVYLLQNHLFAESKGLLIRDLVEVANMRRAFAVESTRT